MKAFYALRRALLKHAYPEFLWPKEIDVDGAKIKIRGAPYSYGVKRLLVRGGYEAHERELLGSEIRPDDQVIEMGGSIGVLAAVLQSKLSSAGKLVSVEADDKLAMYSRTWLEKVSNTHVLNGFAFPISKFNKKPKITGFTNEGGSLGGTAQFEMEEDSSDTGDSADTYDLETIQQKFDLQPTVLVVDVEGSETIMLETKPNYPDSLRLILIEMHPHMYGEAVMQQMVEAIKSESFVEVAESGHTYLFKRVS